MRLCAELVRSSDELVPGDARRVPRGAARRVPGHVDRAARDPPDAVRRRRPVTAVGDPMQAIYGWRSASVANIDAFAAALRPRRRSAPVRVLSVNRRSGTPILEAANRVAAGLRAQHPQVARCGRRRRGRPRCARRCCATVADERDVDRRPGARRWSRGHAARGHRDAGARQRPARAAATAARRARRSGEHLGHGRADRQPVRDRRPVHAAGPGRLGRQHLAGGAPRRAALADRPARPRAARRAVRFTSAGGRPARTDSAAGREPVCASGCARPASSRTLSSVRACWRPPGIPGRGCRPQAAERLAEFLGELRLLQSQVGAPLADLVGAWSRVTGARVEADLASGGQGIGDVGAGRPSAPRRGLQRRRRAHRARGVPGLPRRRRAARAPGRTSTCRPCPVRSS